MSVPATSALPVHPPKTSARSLALLDQAFRLLCQSACCLILLVVALLVLILVERSWLAIRTVGLGFLTHVDWNPNANPPVFGALAFVYGTLATSAIAMLIAVPLGVGTAAYLSEIASFQLRRVASFFIEMLAAIPSVIYGFWGIFVLAPLVQRVFSLLGGPNTGGRGLLSAGLVLSVMIVPYIAAISYDVCQAVPRSQREGSLALGATRWQTIWSVVLPYARPGIIAGAFLALGRALGETMAVTMLIGNRDQIQISPFAVGDSIASRLANQYMEADRDLFRSVLVELGLLLMVVTVTINTLARILLHRVGSNKPLLPIFWPRRKAPAVVLEPPASPPTSSPASEAVTATPPARRPEQSSRPAAEPRAPLQGQPRLLSAGAVNAVMTWVLWGCVAFTMSILVIILGYLLVHGITALNWGFFTELPASPTAESGGGLANAIVGTVKVVGWATALAVPVGLLAAIFLAEYRPDPLARTVRFIAEQLAGVPSIVIGIFATGMFSLATEVWYHRFGVRLRFYGWSGVFALAVMMVPIVMRAAEEALKLVPTSLRNAAFALGASHAQTIVKVTVPAALPAIITAIFLSVARIAGETAPLLLTAGYNNFWPRSLNDFTPTLPPYIFKFATSPSPNWQRQAWAAAFLLMALVLLLNFGIRAVTGKRVVQASRAD
jgi:phosphate transport system permease protein